MRDPDGYARIPYYVREALINYLEYGANPGSFLEGVLTNDWANAVARADLASFEAMKPLCIFLKNKIPQAAWGSASAFNRWREDAAFRQRMRPWALEGLKILENLNNSPTVNSGRA